jgi:Protoporphyrinogen oxidase
VKKTILVIGAGPAGLTAALQLVKEGHRVEVFESSEHVGGMSRSFELWGQRVDLGPHRFFSMDDRINAFWKEHAGKDFILVNRLTRIFYNKKFFLYPIKALDALSRLGIWESFLCGWSYFIAQFRKRGNEKTFEEWVSNRFGYRLYSIFFKSYSERLWGIPCTQLDADFAAQRIKGLSLGEVIKSALSAKAGKKHKTLVDQFAYPLLGCGQAYQNLTNEFLRLGGTLHLNSHVKKILVEPALPPPSHAQRPFKLTGIELINGQTVFADHVISTAPFTDMILAIPQLNDVHAYAKELTYRNTTLVFLKIDQKDIFKDNWIYVHEKNLQTGRISNFRNWSPAMYGTHDEAILCLEYWSYDMDALWTMGDADLIALAKREITETALVAASAILDGHVVRMHRSYPVYSCGYREKLEKLQRAAGTISGVHFIGRNGSFKYNNQDHSILMGLLVAENIVQCACHNLWSINTDYDYQEGQSSLIKNEQ